MSNPKVSVLIPAYNQADYLGEAIQSVLNQTYSNFEIVVVNDCSTDSTAEVVEQFDDPRLINVAHKKNRGLPATRNTGICVSSGEVIALLDADDLFHPEKLEVHVDFLEKNPDIGLTYNPHFDLNYSSTTIRGLWWPPDKVDLADLVLGFPFNPSDMVLRREWVFGVNLWDENYTYFGEDLDMNCRLALAGCKMASVNRALSYRRHHSGRQIRNLSQGCDTMNDVRERVFADPRCPRTVGNLRHIAMANNYLVWSIYAFLQNDTSSGQEYLRSALQLNPGLLEHESAEMINRFLVYSVADESEDHVQLLGRIFRQLPEELAGLSKQYELAVAEGYLAKGTRAFCWGRVENGRRHFAKAKEKGATINKSYIQKLTAQLLVYEKEFGSVQTEGVLQKLAPCLRQIGGRAVEGQVRGEYLINKAFSNYSSGRDSKVARLVLKAYFHNPKLLTNRGTLSIMLRSLVELGN